MLEIHSISQAIAISNQAFLIPGYLNPGKRITALIRKLVNDEALSYYSWTGSRRNISFKESPFFQLTKGKIINI